MLNKLVSFDKAEVRQINLGRVGMEAFESGIPLTQLANFVEFLQQFYLAPIAFLR